MTWRLDRTLLLLGCLTIGAPSLAKAEEAPWAGRYDARVREVTFRPEEVVAINGSYGVSTMIVLGEDEKIETLALGDSIAWKVEPNKRGNIIFVKPVEKNAFSNLNVVTSKRIYSFILRADFRQGRSRFSRCVFAFRTMKPTRSSSPSPRSARAIPTPRISTSPTPIAITPIRAPLSQNRPCRLRRRR